MSSNQKIKIKDLPKIERPREKLIQYGPAHNHPSGDTEPSEDGVVPRSILIDERFGRTRTGKTDLFSFFGREIFQNPKPAKLIKFLIKIIPNKDALILDFMAVRALLLRQF